MAASAPKRKIEGLEGLGGSGADPRFDVNATNVTRGVAKPTGGVDLNKVDNIEFVINTRADQMIRQVLRRARRVHWAHYH